MISRYRIRKLLAPTAGIRQALFWIGLGFVCFVLGVALSFRVLILPLLDGLTQAADDWVLFAIPDDSRDLARHILAGLLLFVGIFGLYRGGILGVRKVVETITGRKGGSVDDYVRRQVLSQGPRIVALGGGTGLSTILRGLKTQSSNITAIVTVTDDGGSSGKLVKEKGMIPPGDIRNCLVALADAEKAMTDLFQHRFKADSGALSGHSIGNLLIAALVDQSQGDFDRAIALASEVLYIRGKVVPSTLERVGLRAVLEDGREVCGETNIVESARRIRRIFLEPARVEGFAAAIEGIMAADLICIGPGSVYTSVIPNLLVPGIAEALLASKAKRVYVCNVMTQAGESDQFTAAEHVSAIQANVDHKLFDYVMVNTGTPSPQILERYREQHQHLVEADIDRIKAMGFKVIAGNFMSETDVLRHDPMKVALRALALLDRR
jgi:uncharacterized cofD-like protein